MENIVCLFKVFSPFYIFSHHLITRRPQITDRTRNIARVDDEAGAERAERLEAQKVAEELRVKTNAEVNMKFQEVMAEEVRFVLQSLASVFFRIRANVAFCAFFAFRQYW